MTAALFGEQFDNVTDGLDVFGIVIGNGDVEFFTESVDQEELIHGVGLQIFNKAGFRRDVGAVIFRTSIMTLFTSSKTESILSSGL